MAFERFKQEISNWDKAKLKESVNERQKVLLRWNNPTEKTVELGSLNPNTKYPRTISRHPFDKVKREIAILKLVLHQKKD